MDGNQDGKREYLEPYGVCLSSAAGADVALFVSAAASRLTDRAQPATLL